MKTATQILSELAETCFNNQCCVTLKEFRPHGFVIHHVREIEDDVLWKYYPKSPKGRDRYYNDLRPLVESDPSRFALVTNPIHNKLDNKRNGITRLKMDNRKRFCDLALRTIHGVQK
jgi:hypothetical protein